MDLWHFPTALAVLILTAGSVAAQVSENMFTNPSFEEAVDADGVPAGWALYAGVSELKRLESVSPGDDGERALLLDNGDSASELGINQTVAADPLLVYEASVMVKGVEGRSSGGAYIQLRFLPSNEFRQRGLVAPSSELFK
ncbi:MAG TPA: hypothetical protein QGH10_05170, partial [Armatimonadota bacterium]|nr:hypothetical protein [Armatimonadota bacterium]